MLDETKDAVRGIVLELSETEEPITDQTELLISGLLDSMGVVQVVATIEDHVGQEIPPLDITIENFETLQAIFDYVATRARTQ